MEMLKNYKYIPKKIIEIREEIKSKHLELLEGFTNRDFNIRDLEKLIEEIRQLDKNQLKIYSYKLKPKELQSLILYMPENRYNIELWKINEIINTRFKKNNLILFFNAFQNHYSNKEFNQYFIQYINKVENSHELLGISANAVPILLKWLEEDYILEIIIEDYFKLNRKLDSYLGFCGFKSNRGLYKDCWRYFLTVCRGKDYLNNEVDKILDIIKVYELDLLAKFLDNYLLKLEIEEFQDEILNYIYLTYDTPLNNSHKYLWDKVSEDAKDRYNIWYANKKLIEFFQGDERYEFWFRYIKDLDAKLLGVNDRQLFLDFDKFVVIEFRYIGNAAYIYSKPYYLINYDGEVSNNRMEDDGYYKNQGSALSRIIHRENWQYRTTKLIWELKNHAL